VEAIMMRREFRRFGKVFEMEKMDKILKAVF
jgi:hypothetical protein